MCHIRSTAVVRVADPSKGQPSKGQKGQHYLTAEVRVADPSNPAATFRDQVVALLLHPSAIDAETFVPHLKLLPPPSSALPGPAQRPRMAASSPGDETNLS